MTRKFITPLSVNADKYLLDSDSSVELNLLFVNDQTISTQVQDALMLILDTALMFPASNFDQDQIDTYKRWLDQLAIWDATL